MRFGDYLSGCFPLTTTKGFSAILPRASRVCNLCNTGAPAGDERYMLPYLDRSQVALLLAFAVLFWRHEEASLSQDQHDVCRYIIACLDKMPSY